MLGWIQFSSIYERFKIGIYFYQFMIQLKMGDVYKQNSIHLGISVLCENCHSFRSSSDIVVIHMGVKYKWS